jgi:glycosyltransferase involved in cell wall biosynthesis
MRHLVIITQNVDEQDDLLGFFVDWIREFAQHAEKVSVITLAKGAYKLPDNVSVYSLGKEYKSSKILQFLRFYWYAFTKIPRSDVVFAHMSPIFAIAAWPTTLFSKTKILLWYLHRSRTLRLLLAEKLVYRIATAAAESLQIQSPKIVAVGHGIQSERFIADRTWEEPRETKIISVGRISPIKDYETLIRAFGILQQNETKFRAVIVGRPMSEHDERYRGQLTALVSRLQISDVVTFAGFIPFAQVYRQYQEAHIAVNLTPRGGIDKAVLEGMAAGCIPLTSNDVFATIFGEDAPLLVFKHGDPRDLVDKIKRIISLPMTERKLLSERLVRVAQQHSVVTVVKRITELV